jgi:hypothetical protein
LKKNFPRTPLLVPRTTELSKDVDPHLDQGLIVDPLTVVTMGLAAPEPIALGQPLSEGLYPGVSSNPSTIKHQHPKINHENGGDEISYRFSAGMHKQRTRMPMAACITEGKNTYFAPSTVVPRWENNRNGTFCVHYFRKAYNASEKAKILKFLW